jgi:hypothetical protein
MLANPDPSEQATSVIQFLQGEASLARVIRDCYKMF